MLQNEILNHTGLKTSSENKELSEITNFHKCETLPTPSP